jgi:hypothetical protein
MAIFLEFRTESPGPDIASRALNMITPSEKRKSSPRKKLIPSLLLNLPEALLLHIFSFFVAGEGVEIDDYLNIQAVDTKFNSLINSCILWQFVPQTLPDGSMNMNALSYIKQKNKGTEGYCFKARRRRDNSLVALKRARVYPLVQFPSHPRPLTRMSERRSSLLHDARTLRPEGLPSSHFPPLVSPLPQRLTHPNICPLQFVNLHNFKLHLIFPYVEMTLHDVLNPLNRIWNYSMKKNQV